MAVNIGPRIGIEGEAEYRKQINSIIQQSKTLATQMKALTSSFDSNGKTMKQNSEQYKLLSEQINNQKSKVESMKGMLEKATQAYQDNKAQLDMHKSAVTEDSAEIARLEREVQKNEEAMQKWQQNVNLATAELNEMENELKQLPSNLDMAASKISDMGTKLEAFGDKVSSIGANLTAKITTPIVAAFGASAKSAIDWETAFTGVMKTVDETATTTYDDLKNSINEIAKTTASSQNEIAAVMEIAGQLGVSADNIADFTKTMVMLGDTTNLSSEEAASSIAKFANVTNMSLDQVDKLGAVIVDLGNNYATTEADIMEMATRLSGAGAQVGLTQGEILGLATALSSVGIAAEMGGSAFSKAMIKMQVAVETGFDQVNALTEEAGMNLREIELMSTNDTKGFKELASSLGMTTTEIKEVIKNGNNLINFAEVAGVSTEEFVELYRKDAPGALEAFINGLGDTEAAGESTIAMLQDMGFTEVRLRDTLTRLANSHGLVSDAMKKGNLAWDENAALSAEAEKRYATMAAKMSQLKASLTEVAVGFGELLMPYLTEFVAKAKEVIDTINGMDDAQKAQIMKIAAIVAAVGPLLMIIGKLIVGVGQIMQFAPAIATGIQGITGSVGAMSTSFVAALGPIAAIVAIIGVLIAAFATLWNNNEQFRNSMTETWNHIKESFSGFASQIEERLPAIQEAFTNVVNFVKPLWENFCAILGPAFEAAFQLISVILDALFTRIVSVIDMITGVLTGNKELFMQGLQTFLQSIWTLIQETWAIWWQWILSTINVLLSFFGTSLEQIKTLIFNTLVAIGLAVTTKAQELVEFVTEKITEICDFIASLPDKFYQWGVDMIQSLIDGIESMVDKVGDAIEGVAEKIAEFIHFSEPDKGPLSNFHTFMPDMMKQLAAGIEAGRYQVQAAAAHVAADIAAPMSAGANVTLNNNFTFSGGYTEADGREIVRSINRQLGALYI